MPLMPKRVKYRKSQRGSRKGTASRNLKIDFGEFGLQTLERAWITNTQLEAARVALTRNMKRKGKLWIRIFPDKSVTSRPPETRMGKGKGQPEFWVATVRPGNILFELDGAGIGGEGVLAAGGGQVAGAHEISHTAPCEGRLSVMKMKEITELSTDELLTKRRDLRQERLHLRLQQQSGQLEQPSRLRFLRRDIARIETELSQREKQTETK
jgi:large subunit ribosomal protein L16